MLCIYSSLRRTCVTLVTHVNRMKKRLSDIAAVKNKPHNTAKYRDNVFQENIKSCVKLFDIKRLYLMFPLYVDHLINSNSDKI